MSESNFTKLASIDVGSKLEKKNGLSYLSWAWAVDQLLRADSGATWTYGSPAAWGQTVMVFCTVKAFGKEMTAQLPVMDHRNKAIPNPDAFAVNTAMQRCLVKAIALHGLGLYIYAGEDLPRNIDEEAKLHRESQLQELAMAAVEKFEAGNEWGAYEEYSTLTDNEEKLYVWGLLKKHSALRAAIKRLGEEERRKQTEIEAAT